MIRDHPVEARRGAALVTAVSLAFVATALIFLAIEIANGWSPLGEPGVAQTVIAVAIFALSFPLVGWIILRRDPSNRLGWIYLAIGFWQSLNMFASGYSTLAYWVASGSLPLASELSWVAVWAWVPGFTLFSTLGILLFPTGRLPSRRWWPVVAVAVLAFVLLLVPVVALWPYRGLPLERLNALNLPPPTDPVVIAASAIQGMGQVVLLVAMIGSVAGLAIRFRRSTGIERQQLKWFTYAAIVDVLLLVVWTVIPLDPLAGALSSLLLAFLPIAIAIAILRYRLYDIDRIVSRTIGYAIITFILGVTFVGIVLVVQAVVDSLLPQVTETGTPAVAASTLAAAALFQPIRRRVQATVDRRFDRARVDRDRSIVRLGNRLRDAVELDAIRADLLGTIDATIRPANATVWLRRS
ncbi:MAG TPA: hypothetical protein VIM39_04885 [Candidatus Limnocylindrales bacterium]